MAKNRPRNFIKVTFLLKKLQKSWFYEIFFDESKFFIFSHCNVHVKESQCGNCRNSLSHFFRKNFVKAMILYTTVWKSKVKCDHVQKFSVKIHTWILPKEVRERISAISTLWRTKWMVFFLFGALLGYPNNKSSNPCVSPDAFSQKLHHQFWWNFAHTLRTY